MATKNRIEIKSSIRQKVWNYIRRNRTFRFGDVIVITGVTYSYLNNMLRALKATGYIKELERVKPYNSTQFTLIKCTGVQCPSFKNKKVYDYNTKEEITIEHKPVVIKLLEQMNQEIMTKYQIIENTDVSFDVSKKWFRKLAELGLIADTSPVQRIDGRKAFKIDIEKVEKLKNDIEDGTFKLFGALSSTIKRK